MTKLKKEDLSVGMVLAEDIYSNTGAVLIGAGTKLDATHMRFIGRADMTYIHVEDDVIETSVAPAEPIEQATADKPKTYQKDMPRYNLQERYQNTVSKFKNIYYDFRLGRVPVFQEIEDLVEPLYEAILNDEHITSKMWQIQAYDDYTFDHSVRVSMIAGL